MLQWIEENRGEYNHWWYSRIVVDMDLAEFGISGRIHTSLSASIHSRIGRHSHAENFPYLLLVQGNRSYFKTVEEAKTVAEQIFEKYLQLYQGIICTNQIKN